MYVFESKLCPNLRQIKVSNKKGNSGFDLTTRDLYFMILVSSREPYSSRKHIFRELYRVNRKLWSTYKYQIIPQCINFKNIFVDDFLDHPFLYRVIAF